jgi:hypothetical protein
MYTEHPVAINKNTPQKNIRSMRRAHIGFVTDLACTSGLSIGYLFM